MSSEHVTGSDNLIFTLAENFIEQTARPVFLTGKAGTGKTTFLRHIQKNTTKKTVVAAPTGVAAIQCGGTTLHSLFQLPFKPFIPAARWGAAASADLSDQYTLLKELKYDSEKRNLLRELELLIIDEISMVRCDTIDAIDTILRHFRKKTYTPFGGVQVLFIGDLFQLPPVVQDSEWRILQEHYEGPFFFQAKVMEQSRPLYIELDKIYRQQDARFIGILNRIRNNDLEDDDLLILNERYQPAYQPPEDVPYITLTTHNHKADAINTAALEKLPGELHRFEGVVEGDFPERNFPTDRSLSLKVGAQVMFIKNDMEKVRRYYNGKVGIVREIGPEKIVVGFTDSDQELEVIKDTWKNIRYTYNPSTRQIEEEVLGTFQQYAIRLAWAITIHKSQGLTFHHAIIDAGSSFAPGQVYVALSRCTSLEGLILRSRIFRQGVMTDERVVRFAASAASVAALGPVLQQERRRYALNALLEKLDWINLVDTLTAFQEALQQQTFRDKEMALALCARLLQEAGDQHTVSLRFQEQLKRLFTEGAAANDFNAVYARVEKGMAYFTDKLDQEFIGPLALHQKAMEGKARVKGYRKELQSLAAYLAAVRERFQQSNTPLF